MYILTTCEVYSGGHFLKTSVKFLLLCLLTIFLASCSQDSSQIKHYEGKSLKIAVVGKIPKVYEKNIIFSNITLDQLINEDTKIDSYNAVFIMENKLSQAANKKYTKLYLESGVPFFFIKSEASYIPFIDNSITYNDYAKRINDKQNYITGILGNGIEEELQSWKYGYTINDNKVDKKNTKGIYSNVFRTIEKTL